MEPKGSLRYARTPATCPYQWRTEGGVFKPPQNSEDIGGVLDRMSKKDRRLDFLL